MKQINLLQQGISNESDETNGLEEMDETSATPLSHLQIESTSQYQIT